MGHASNGKRREASCNGVMATGPSMTGRVPQTPIATEKGAVSGSSEWSFAMSSTLKRAWPDGENGISSVASFSGPDCKSMKRWPLILSCMRRICPLSTRSRRPSHSTRACCRSAVLGMGITESGCGATRDYARSRMDMQDRTDLREPFALPHCRAVLMPEKATHSVSFVQIGWRTVHLASPRPQCDTARKIALWWHRQTTGT
ncbi:MAG: hypothetical protein BWZ07_03152 [Alphaproteobacteria bacterium ADurb.BinA280]|nr:MAG: hypothetical protein BWZ07_03152 [Alphaproteobacteria bacterium ADurb.BinA280]